MLIQKYNKATDESQLMKMIHNEDVRDYECLYKDYPGPNSLP